ncbi:MAG: hypothetical protein J2P15_08340 [Micromonosporaceae bacterium]|nr:hypothetical protein [Micromonosporaceae bacterium]
MANTSGNGLLIIERILRDRGGIWRQISEERDLKALTVQLLVSSAVSLAAYGLVLGSSRSFYQALSSMVKLPLLFLATLAICLPTLYLFNLVFGARLTMAQAVALIMVSITVTSVLTLAFAPISLFFLITAQSYEFFKLLNVAILMLTAIVGLRFLTTGMRALNEHGIAKQLAQVPVELPEAAPEREPVPVAVPAGGVGAAVAATVPAATVALPVAPPIANGTTPPVPAPALVPIWPSAKPAPQPARGPHSTSMTLLYIWILLFGFVGTQLAWTLRPFFGDPGRPFSLFRHISGTFYSDILRSIAHLFS